MHSLTLFSQSSIPPIESEVDQYEQYVFKKNGFTQNDQSNDYNSQEFDAVRKNQIKGGTTNIQLEKV